jgi:hypothetical protein
MGPLISIIKTINFITLKINYHTNEYFVKCTEKRNLEIGGNDESDRPTTQQPV